MSKSRQNCIFKVINLLTWSLMCSLITQRPLLLPDHRYPSNTAGLAVLQDPPHRHPRLHSRLHRRQTRLLCRHRPDPQPQRLRTRPQPHSPSVRVSNTVLCICISIVVLCSGSSKKPSKKMKKMPHTLLHVLFQGAFRPTGHLTTYKHKDPMSLHVHPN